MPPARVLVTGGAGNLGSKLASTLAATSWCREVIALDRAEAPAAPRLRPVVGDLRRAEPAWTEAFAGVDAVVHLAAQNPYPDATWTDSAASFDMTAQMIEAAVRHGVGRLVFASSNHVMGGYKDNDPPLAPGTLSVDLPPRVGTISQHGDVRLDSTPYAAAKLMGERLCSARAGTFTSVSLRIGWCQPGANQPETLSATGTPKLAEGGDQAHRDLCWFQDMWLSNRDFAAVLLAALTADAAGWPTPAIIVNAMSGNRGMPWDIASTATLIGYRPQDDVRRRAAPPE